MSGPAALRPRTSNIDWDSALGSVLAEPDRVRPAFQPIFDLRHGVVAGFEMLARFDAPVNATPVEWLAAAQARGLGPQLEAVLLSAGLRAREILPASCFLAINLSPEALLSPEVAALIEGRDLTGVVVEITDTAAEGHRLEAALDRLRALGADVAVDDAGLGYASLRRVLRLRPTFVKLDRELISGIDHDPAKLALVEAMGLLAGRLDASIVAEGVERTQERDVLTALGVPLAQGFALARPGRELLAGLRLPGAPPPDEGIAAIVDREATVVEAAGVPEILQAADPLPGRDSAVVVDDDGRPSGLLLRMAAGAWRLKQRVLAIHPSEPPARVAERAMTRSIADRFDPIACCDESGRLIGLVAVDHLVQALARAAAG